mmetsp:Transcript_116529/g.201311  ORF Transcript_116529/g.201311 Transcript_116529/m.201311 type:complete len:509 (-) Transcript_116529:161-1687(-)
MGAFTLALVVCIAHGDATLDVAPEAESEQDDFGLLQTNLINGIHLKGDKAEALSKTYDEGKSAGDSGKKEAVSESETQGKLHSPKLSWPVQAVRCSENQAMKTEHMTLTDYDDAVASVQRLYQKMPAHCTATSCPRSDWAGCILRLGAHDFMDYSHQAGGSDGCIALLDADNAGLIDCLAGTETMAGLRDAYDDFCSRISLADFIVIGAEAVMNITRQNVLNDQPNRKQVDFRSKFKYGRVTNSKCESAIGKMPDAERGCDAVQDTMLSNMGLSWNQSAALMGAHTIGQASLTRSGYDGRWVTAASSLRFDNDYYMSIILKGWAPQPKVGGRPAKNQWKRVDIGVNHYSKGTEMMLDSDMCLYHSPYDHQVVPNPLHASISGTQGCNCAWVRGLDHLQAIANNDNEFCGTKDFYPGLENLGFGTSGHLGIPNENTLNFTKQRIVCCGVQEGIIIDPKVDCGLPNMPWGPAAAAVAHFAADEEDWLTAYHEAWDIATTNGYSSLAKLKD